MAQALNGDTEGAWRSFEALSPAHRSANAQRGPAYERGRPNELWHIDIKGPFFLRRSRSEYEKVWIVGLVDDHSRFLIGLRVLPQPRTAPILAGSTTASSCVARHLS